jgi:hypothetical protein
VSRTISVLSTPVMDTAVQCLSCIIRHNSSFRRGRTSCGWNTNTKESLNTGACRARSGGNGCSQTQPRLCARARRRRLTLLGKSLGTLAVGHVLASHASSLTHAKAVWLTPLLTDPEAREMIDRIDNASLYVMGSADEAYDRAFASRLEGKPNARVMVIEGADHSLEVADSIRSIGILKDIVEAIQEFVLK